MQAGRNAQIARVDEWPQIHRAAGFVGLQELMDRAMDCVLAQFSEQQPGALTKAARMAISTKQQDLVGIRRIRQSAHAAKGTRAVMQRMGCHRQGGFGKRHALATEPGVRQKLMHGVGGRRGHCCN